MDFIPLSIPNFEGNERKYVDDAVAQGWVSTGGAYITELEERLSSFLNTEDVAACQSGTAGLHLSLIEAGVRPGDMVIVPSVTFIAAVNPVKYQFASPVFMDCDESLCMDPVKIREFCNEECEFCDGKLIHKSGSHVKAIMVVHIFGNLADMESIMELAEQYNLKVIEDATEALGSKYTAGRYKGKYAGTIGDYGVFSFNGNKIITTGGGGAVTAREPKTTAHMRFLSTQAKNDPCYYIHNEIGYNYRMTNIQAALGAAQMEMLPDFIRRKQENYDLYKTLFEGFEYGRILNFRDGTNPNKWFYSLEIEMEKLQCTLKDIITSLHGDGIQTRAIWGLIHEQIPYKNDLSYKIEKASYYGKRILNIPCSTQITKSEIQYVAKRVRETISTYSK